MSQPKSEIALETWRLLIVRRNGDEMLVNTSEGKCVLPRVQIPAHERIAANINRAVQQNFGISVISLYEVAPCDFAEAGSFYHVVVAIRAAEQPRGETRWISTESLAPNSFLNDRDFAAFCAFRSRLDASRTHTNEPFGNLHWFGEVRKWVARSIIPRSLHLSGEFRQLNASTTFSLIRFETNRSPVWFKAVGEPNVRELGVTLALSHLCSVFIPQVLASKKKWNAWLSLEACGESLAANGELPRWKQASASLAGLQIASMNGPDELRLAGARDLRPSQLLAALEPFFGFVSDSTARSPLQNSKNLTLLEVAELKEIVRVALEDLEALSVVNSVGHMDLSPANIFCTAHRAVFLDWAEAFVGCPLFSFEYVLQHFRQAFPQNPRLTEELRTAYLRPWRSIISPKDLERALVRSPLVAMFAYAATVWSSARTYPAQQPSRQRYLLSLVRKMKQETQHPESDGVRR